MVRTAVPHALMRSQPSRLLDDWSGVCVAAVRLPATATPRAVPTCRAVEVMPPATRHDPGEGC